MKKDLMYRSLDSIGQTGNRLAKSPPEEPDASIAHVRVCEGPGRKRPGLLGIRNMYMGSAWETKMNDNRSDAAEVVDPREAVKEAFAAANTAWAAKNFSAVCTECTKALVAKGIPAH